MLQLERQPLAIYCTGPGHSPEIQSPLAILHSSSISIEAPGKGHSHQGALEQGIHYQFNPLLAKRARRELQHNVEAYAEQERRPAEAQLHLRTEALYDTHFSVLDSSLANRACPCVDCTVSWLQ